MAAPAWIVETNACAKRDDVAAGLDTPVVAIAADTLVFYEEHVLPKPVDAEAARGMLRMLSGTSS